MATRLTCACAGCQAFARRLDPALLDAYGGTERLIVDPGPLRFAGETDQLGCIQQTRGGALRWYARCCRTPIGLTLNRPGVPFVGLDAQRLHRATSQPPLDAIAGPIRARVNHRLPRRARRALRADGRSLLAMLAHLAPQMWRWWRQGSARRAPFFTPSRAPAAPVEALYDTRPSLAQTTGCR